MFDRNRGGNAASYPECCGQPHEAGRQKFHEIIENLIADSLVERSLIPEGPDIQLEGLEFDAQGVRDIFES